MSITVRYNVERMAEDIAARGWHPSGLADRVGVARSTVGRFLSGEFQTAKTAEKLAKGLGYSVRRYLISAKAVA
jgi:transcriptional regulator with XRE-family HTH domain